MRGFRGLGCQRVRTFDCDRCLQRDHGLVSSESSRLASNHGLHGFFRRLKKSLRRKPTTFPCRRESRGLQRGRFAAHAQMWAVRGFCGNDSIAEDVRSSCLRPMICLD